MYHYSHGRCHRFRRYGSAQSSVIRRSTENLATVVTVVEPELRPLIDQSTQGWLIGIHVDGIDDAFQAVRGNAARAVLLSAAVVRQKPLAAVARLVAKTPGVAVALIATKDNRPHPEDLLDLGACGVRQVLNLAHREGWNRLRAVAEDAGGETASRIMELLMPVLEPASQESRQFFGSLVRCAPNLTTVRDLAAVIGVLPSTLMSRFFRAQLPPPKAYLSMIRLVYAASYFETPEVSIADVTGRLGFSSPQSFGRHVRSVLGLTAGEFRRERPFLMAVGHFTERLIVPYMPALARFDPVGVSPVRPQLAVAEA
jgi:AraC-like DNA-binding protein